MHLSSHTSSLVWRSPDLMDTDQMVITSVAAAASQRGNTVLCIIQFEIINRRVGWRYRDGGGGDGGDGGDGGGAEEQESSLPRTHDLFNLRDERTIPEAGGAMGKSG
ncbi:hypothetical protein TWF694_008683 [Orbilia ellipsospora]|uniref:Uncharacterized protein n=1 Tax=Orbilia ellipsospora TaxID=2528407 RepID=A0AAV9XCR8_9PEZI